MKITNKLLTAGIFISIMLVLFTIIPAVANAQYNNCTYHAYRLCGGNNIYWFDSCEHQQDLYSNCGGLFCQYGQCVSSLQNYNNNYTATYQPYYTKICSGSTILWYDSLGVKSGVYKNCTDGNSCTLDSCSAIQCINTLRCDGSTCAVNSAEYNTYCQTSSPNQNNQTEKNIQNGLSVSFFAKQNTDSGQWQKTAEIGSNGTIYFMISITNNSSSQIDNVNVLANIPSEISSLGNVQINGTPVSGDIVLGINIGSIASNGAKQITFEGKTQAISSKEEKQAIATIDISKMMQSDSISINFNPNQTTASVSDAPATSGFWGFLKRWYVWIFIGLALILLFIIVFKRLSSNV